MDRLICPQICHHLHDFDVAPKDKINKTPP